LPLTDKASDILSFMYISGLELLLEELEREGDYVLETVDVA
jgi:hypothetical protein